MRGRTPEEIKTERELAIKWLELQLHEEVELIDSYFEDYQPSTGNVALKHLGKSLELLADADLAVFLGEWYMFRGCKIEFDCVKAYGIEYIDFSDNEEDEYEV